MIKKVINDGEAIKFITDNWDILNEIVRNAKLIEERDNSLRHDWRNN